MSFGFYQVCLDCAANTWRRNLMEFFSNLTLKLGLSENICHDAIEIFKNSAKDTPFFIGTVASVYAAAKYSHECIPLSWARIEDTLYLDGCRPEIYRQYARLMLRLEEKPQLCTLQPSKMLDTLFGRVQNYPLKPEVHMLSEEVLLDTKTKTGKLLSRIEEKRLHQGRNPVCIVAAAIWLTSLETCLDSEKHSKTRFFSITRITESLSISDPSLRNNARRIAKGLNLPVSKLLQKGNYNWQSERKRTFVIPKVLQKTEAADQKLHRMV